MTHLRCLRTESLLQRRVAGLAASEALQLEEHLAGCAECNEKAQMLSGMRKLVTAAGAPLSSVARTRAITAALATAQPVAPTRDVRTMLWPAAGLAFAGAVALLLVARMEPSGRQAPAVAVAPPPTAAPSAAPIAVNSDGVLSGDVVRRGAELHSERGGSVALAHAAVELRAQTTARWSAETRELYLTAGSVMANVDPARHQSFSVRTDRFTVHVLGTRFEVTQDTVHVLHGRVRVVDASGAPLAMLDAGQRYDAGTTVAPEAKTEPRPRLDTQALLERARGELVGKQTAAARRTIDLALQQHLPPAVHAEALSLRADCALVEGDKRGAASAYLRVAERFAKLPAGESALFAAARLQAEQGDQPAAARSLSRYLARYPQGRFVKEANSRLRELGVSADPSR
jgi:FecR protein